MPSSRPPSHTATASLAGRRHRRRGYGCSRPRPASSAETRCARAACRRRGIGGGEQPPRPTAVNCTPEFAAAAPGFVPDDVRFVADDHLVAGPGQDLEGDLVRHRAARHEERRLLAEQFGDPLLQPVDRRVLAVLVVADRRRRHRLAHPRRGRGDGIRAQVDAVHGEPGYGCARDSWGENPMKLYTYYRSQASFRVRIALNLKGLAREDSFLHLEQGDQFAAEYRAINPQMVVPTLIDGDTKLFQSLAILEYLDEQYPEPPLLPSDPQARAWVRGLALINAADSHPLIVPRIRHYLTDTLKLSEQQKIDWIQHWLGAGLQAIEALLAEHPASGRFCHGERPTIADICLVTQVTPAKTFDLPLDPYPRVMRVYDTCMAIPAFADAHPSKQPDTE